MYNCGYLWRIIIIIYLKKDETNNRYIVRIHVCNKAPTFNLLVGDLRLRIYRKDSMKKPAEAGLVIYYEACDFSNANL